MLSRMRLILGLVLAASMFTVAAEGSRNQGAVNTLCQNLTNACSSGDEASCQALTETGCKCDAASGECTRGNYSN